MKSKQLKAMGMTCGIGSMLIGARAAGFKVLGNVEWRKYYHTGTFERNFKGAFMIHRLDQLTDEQWDQIIGVDLVMGHPECGNFSRLNTSKRIKELALDPGDIPLFIDAIAKIKPRFVVMDDLPGSLVAFKIDEYKKRLPEYDLYWEWISNYHYGNVQRYRTRFFLIAALKSEKFVFTPGEFDHSVTLADAIKGLPLKRDIVSMNHVHKTFDEIIQVGWNAHQFGLKRPGNKVTYGDIAKYIRDWPTGKNFIYKNLKGETKIRPGYFKININRHAPVMSGGGSALDNHYREDTLLPLTPRERARIQGCPDDFIFLPADRLQNAKDYAFVYKQIGKFMPVQFCTYAAQLIASHIKGKRMKSTGERLIKSNPLIDSAKLEYCGKYGYSNQKGACLACWLKATCSNYNDKNR